jgi:hypothetical protein
MRGSLIQFTPWRDLGAVPNHAKRGWVVGQFEFNLEGITKGRIENRLVIDFSNSFNSQIAHKAKAAAQNPGNDGHAHRRNFSIGDDTTTNWRKARFARLPKSPLVFSRDTCHTKGVQG